MPIRQVDDDPIGFSGKRLEYQVGPDEWRTPFSSVGDSISFEIHRTYRVDQAYYRRSVAMTPIKVQAFAGSGVARGGIGRAVVGQGFAYLVDESDTRSVGLGLVEFTRTFASIPVARTEYGSIGYSMQFATGIGTATPSVVEVQRVMSAKIYYEYSLTPFVPQTAPRVEIIADTVYGFGGWGNLVAGKDYLAEDSVVRIYKGKIYERRGVYITWPSRETIT